MFYVIVSVYRGYEIGRIQNEIGFYLEYEGESLYFETVEDAKLFIDVVSA